MLVESSSASVVVTFKLNPYGEVQRGIVHKQFIGKDAKERAEQWARRWFANSDVDSVVCKSQCVLKAQ